MQISQTVDFGQISHTYMSTWTDNTEVELYAGEDKVVFTMSEEVMKQLHKKLGDKPVSYTHLTLPTILLV